MHLLVVDDDAELRETLAELLEEEGFRVTQAGSGHEALRALDVERPALIVLDYMMPGMSGADFRKEQLARPDLREIPLVLLTAAKECADFREMKPDAIVKKPFAMSALLDSVAAVLGRSRQDEG